MAFSLDNRSRSWLVTVQVANMEKAGLSKENYEDPDFLANFLIEIWAKSGSGREAGVAVCVSANGLYHAHVACYGNTTTLKRVAEIFFDSHVEPQLGGKSELKCYLEKSGKYEEKGEHVLLTKGLDIIKDKQGKRNDLEEIQSMLENGSTPNEIFAENFRYRKYEKMIKADYLQRRIKKTPLIKEMHNEYHFGDSGTGKTYVYIKKCEEYSEEEVYLCNDYSNSRGSAGGFDFYANNAAKVIVLDEFRGEIPYSQMLSILDVYSRNQQHCRFQNVYALWTSVIICSILSPEQVYFNMVDQIQRSRDTFKQFIRRFEIIVYHYINKDGEYKSYSMPASEYKGSDDIIQRALKIEYLNKEWGAKEVRRENESGQKEE